MVFGGSKSGEEYDPKSNKWSKKTVFFGGWQIALGCIADDKENGRIYSLGGYSRTWAGYDREYQL